MFQLGRLSGNLGLHAFGDLEARIAELLPITLLLSISGINVATLDRTEAWSLLALEHPLRD